MRGLAALAVLFVLTACGENLTPEEQALRDERDIAMVERANNSMPPLKEGEVLRFAADPGARELPLRTRSLYNGREYSLRLQIAGGGEQAEADYTGQVTLRDSHGRVVYEGEGPVQCGG